MVSPREYFVGMLCENYSYSYIFPWPSTISKFFHKCAAKIRVYNLTLKSKYLLKRKKITQSKETIIEVAIGLKIESSSTTPHSTLFF